MSINVYKKMSTFQERFEEEVEKIGISALANHLGVARNTIYNWIGKCNAPLNELMRMQGFGVDVQYILTSKRSPELPVKEESPGYTVTPKLNKREAALLDHYRHIESDKDKLAIEQVAMRTAEAVQRQKECEKQNWDGINRRKKASDM